MNDQELSRMVSLQAHLDRVAGVAAAKIRECEALRDERDLFAAEVERMQATIDSLRAEVARLRKLFDDAGQGDQNSGGGAEAMSRTRAAYTALVAAILGKAPTADILALLVELDAAITADDLVRLWREEADRIGAVNLLLEARGCDCPCDHDYSEHTDDCERCLACRIGKVVQK